MAFSKLQFIEIIRNFAPEFEKRGVFPVTFLLVLMTFRNMAFLIAVATAMVAKAQTERKMTVDELFQLVESNSKTLRFLR